MLGLTGRVDAAKSLQNCRSDEDFCVIFLPRGAVENSRAAHTCGGGYESIHWRCSVRSGTPLGVHRSLGRVIGEKKQAYPSHQRHVRYIEYASPDRSNAHIQEIGNVSVEAD